MKKTKLTKVPILIQLYPEDIFKADLAKALKIDKHHIDRELLDQPATYGFWSALYSAVSAKVSFLQEQIEQRESFLFRKYLKIFNRKVRVGDVKHYINKDEKFTSLKKKRRRWQDAERTLKYAERAFQQRLSVMMAFNANRRQDKRVENYGMEED